MKSLTITIPFMNNLRFGMPMLGNLKYMTSEEVEWIVVDNGSTDPIEQYIRNYIKPKKLNMHTFITPQNSQILVHKYHHRFLKYLQRRSIKKHK